MTFNNLNKWGDFWYFPCMKGLFVFEALTGGKVAEWYVNCELIAGRPYKWSFHELVNTLPDYEKADFMGIVTEWKDTVNARFNEWGGTP